ncbi:hypothetical protein [Chlorogloeopsis sp. ULAP02]|uniref:hypothetical protein n=1 Tax=Chlorogloeopsis sp. ULAP02 TaxID=3107926 RepID=UPI0031366FE8
MDGSPGIKEPARCGEKRRAGVPPVEATGVNWRAGFADHLTVQIENLSSKPARTVVSSWLFSSALEAPLLLMLSCRLVSLSPLLPLHLSIRWFRGDTNLVDLAISE